MRSVGGWPGSGCRWVKSPIFGAERHAGSSSAPSMVMSVVMAVTTADLGAVPTGAVCCGAAAAAGAAAVHTGIVASQTMPRRRSRHTSGL